MKRKATLLLVCVSDQQQSIRQFALRTLGWHVLSAATIADALARHGPSCASVVIHDTTNSYDELAQLAPSAVHWPTRPSRQNAVQLAEVLPHLFAALARSSRTPVTVQRRVL